MTSFTIKTTFVLSQLRTLNNKTLLCIYSLFPVRDTMKSSYNNKCSGILTFVSSLPKL